MTATETPTIGDLHKQLLAEVNKGNEASASKIEALTKQLNDTVVEINKKIDAINDMQRRFSLPGSEDSTHKGQKYSFAKAAECVIRRDPRLAPHEHEMSEQLRKLHGTEKAMSFGSDANVGFLVPNEVLTNELIPLLYPQLVVAQLGARRLDGLTRGPIQIPRLTGGTTAYWVGEAATITPSDLTADMVEGTPKGCAALAVASNLLLQMDNSGVEALIREDFAQRLGLKWDLACFTGTGSSSQPLGILNVAGVNTAAISTTPTYDELLGAINEVRADNAMGGNMGWAFSNADLFALEKMKDTKSPPATAGDGDTNTQPLGTRQWLAGTWPNYTLMGYPLKSTTQLAVSEGPVFGNWSDFLLCRWGGMSLAMTDALGFATAQTHLRMLMWVDNVIRHPESFNVG